MLTTTHNCYSILMELEKQGIDIHEPLREVVQEKIVPKVVVNELVSRNDTVTSFYLYLNNKAHKVIKEILTCQGKSIATYVKIATSLITQSMIAIEHTFNESNIEEQNNFIECIGLTDLADGLSIYFKTGNCEPLIKAVNNNRLDVKQLLD